MIKIACFSPLKAFEIGMKSNGKAKLLVTSYKVDHLEQLPNGHFERIESNDHVFKSINSDVFAYYTTIPCGTCIGCKLEHSRQWANRCLLEAQYHDSNYFLTLTYDDFHLPVGNGVLPDTGEIIETHSLVKEDWQKFMKRLRKAYDEKYPGEKLRFFMCGEYGDKTVRPHYHAIIFGLHLDDLVPYKKTGDYWYYNSPWLQSLWPYGFVVVGNFSVETAAYTARYCTKKLYGDDALLYDQLSLVPPFVLMSRRPGIGYQYLEDNFDKIRSDPYINISSELRGYKFRIPKYFKHKFDSFFDDDDIVYFNQKYLDKEKAKAEMEELRKIMCSQSDNNYLDLLAVQESALRSKLKQLERSL